MSKIIKLNSTDSRIFLESINNPPDPNNKLRVAAIRYRRNKIKSWCRYWHFNVLGPLRDNGGHRNYLTVVSLLDDWHQSDSWENDTLNLEDSWKNVLGNINACDNTQLLELEKYCHSRKD